MYDERQDVLGDRLLRAAAEVFTEFGYDRAKVAEIARRAGVTTGAIYSRYRGKADLLVAALGEHLVDQIERVLPEAPRGGADLLFSLGTHLLDPRSGAEWLLLEAIVSSRRDPELAEMIRRSFEDDQSRISKYIQQGKDDGHIDTSLSTSAIAHFAMALGMGMNVSHLLEREQPNADEWRDVIDRVIAAAAPASRAHSARTDTQKETTHER